MSDCVSLSDGDPRWCITHGSFHGREYEERPDLTPRPGPGSTRVTTERERLAELRADENACMVEAAGKEIAKLRGKLEAAEQSLSSLRAELDEARQALWDVYRILGFDTDGDRTPRSVPNVEAIVIEAAKEFRADYDAAVLESGADGWLEKAAEEIASAQNHVRTLDEDAREFAAILKRHRDGTQG